MAREAPPYPRSDEILDGHVRAKGGVLDQPGLRRRGIS